MSQTRTEDPQQLYNQAIQLLYKKQTPLAISLLTLAAVAKHPEAMAELPKVQFNYAKELEKKGNYTEAAKMYFLSKKFNPLFQLYENQTLELKATADGTDTLSNLEVKTTLHIKLTQESLIITLYTALANPEEYKAGRDLHQNLNILVEKFPEAFIGLTINTSVEIPKLEESAKNAVVAKLYDKISLPIFVLSQSTSLPTVLTQIIIEYLPEFDFILKNSKNIKTFSELNKDGETLQLILDKGIFSSKITLFGDWIRTQTSKLTKDKSKLNIGY